jgi:hypothetical protein
MPDFTSSPDGSGLGAKLAEARKRMAALDLPRPLAARLHRQFIAVCDAVKAAGADEAIGERRLAAFLKTLEQAAARFPGRGNSQEWGNEQARPDRRSFRSDGG